MAAPDLGARLLRTLDIFHRAGLWEMMGQLVIACALARISFVRTCGKEVQSRAFRAIRISKVESAALINTGPQTLFTHSKLVRTLHTKL